jgi:hypothetical protein
MGNCAGIDWAGEKHDLLIEDPAGEELLVATFSHSEDGVSALCAALGCFDVEVVAIERPDGLLVDRLLDSGCGCWRCTPTRSRLLGTASGPRVASLIGLTGSCSASWRAPIDTGSGSWSPIRTPPRRYGR